MAKTLFITGASTGIGAETARQAAQAGWNVALFARSKDKLETLSAEIGETALALPGDVTDLAEVEAAIAKTADHFGGIDAVFANAGKGLDTPGTENGDPAEWREMIDLNIMGLLYTARAGLPELRKTKGTLVLTGSAAGRGGPWVWRAPQPAYWPGPFRITCCETARSKCTCSTWGRETPSESALPGVGGSSSTRGRPPGRDWRGTSAGPAPSASICSSSPTPTPTMWAAFPPSWRG